MRMLLERAGHEVISAENGRRGLRLFFEDRPDLVVLDLRMPELDGWETLERLRDLSDVPVLIVSGQTPPPRSSTACAQASTGSCPSRTSARGWSARSASCSPPPNVLSPARARTASSEGGGAVRERIARGSGGWFAGLLALAAECRETGKVLATERVGDRSWSIRSVLALLETASSGRVGASVGVCPPTPDEPESAATPPRFTAAITGAERSRVSGTALAAAGHACRCPISMVVYVSDGASPSGGAPADLRYPTVSWRTLSNAPNRSLMVFEKGQRGRSSAHDLPSSPWPVP